MTSLTLTNRALLVSLTIRQWTARKFDKYESAAVANRHGTAANVARVNKALLPNADKLEAITKQSTAIRTAYYTNTLPWTQEGVNIIKSSAYIDFTNIIRPMMTDWWSKVEDFLRDYETLRMQAQHSLGSLYDDNDYPSVDQVRQKFDIGLNFAPVPDAADWRVELGDTELDYLKESITKQVQAAQNQALTAAWERIYSVVSKAHERLANPENIFRNSLIENAVELCKLLPSLNIIDDPNLERMRVELENSLCQYDPDTLRSRPAVREQAADQMAELMRKMGAFYSAS